MKQPIRILHIVGVMDQGGIETLLMNLYRNIDRSIIQFDFLTHSTKKGFFDNEIKSLGGKIYSVINPFSLKGLFQYKNSLSSFFNDHFEYTIIHSHMNTFSGIILNIAKNYGIKTRIAHSHASGISNPIRLPMGLIAKQFGQSAITNFFACSKAAAKWNFGKHANKTLIFKNGIDLTKYHFSEKTRSEYRKKLNLEGKYVIGHVGRFTKVKNHSFLIDILSALHSTKNNAILLLCGDGSLLKDMEQKAKSLGINDSVFFLGNRSDVEQLLCAMDIFVFPSTNEGLGIVAIEAQASGLPCLVSDALPSEVKVTELLEYISLDKGEDYWASHIQKCQISEDRDEAYLKVKKQGYDIKESAKWLKDFYIKCEKESKEHV